IYTYKPYQILAIIDFELVFFEPNFFILIMQILSLAHSMLSFRLHEAHWVNPFLKALKLITFAESLGGTESFITYPATQTHMDIPEEERIARGVCNCLLRFSVGLENVEDIKADLLQAFAQLN
ncbi:PLP-dependent transferase, partial [Pasteurella multocida]|nr:PLP-dependent transferase [Pasteurella multocida]